MNFWRFQKQPKIHTFIKGGKNDAPNAPDAPDALSRCNMMQPIIEIDAQNKYVYIPPNIFSTISMNKEIAISIINNCPNLANGTKKV